MTDETVPLPDVTQEQYGALMDALRHTQDNAPTSAGRRALQDVRDSIIEFHDKQPHPDSKPKPIPFYVIQGAIDEAKPQDEYAVVRSDNDWQYARTLDEADTLQDMMMDAAAEAVGHSVVVVELVEVPPEA